MLNKQQKKFFKLLFVAWSISFIIYFIYVYPKTVYYTQQIKLYPLEIELRNNASNYDFIFGQYFGFSVIGFMALLFVCLDVKKIYKWKEILKIIYNFISKNQKHRYIFIYILILLFIYMFMYLSRYIFI